MIEHELLKDRLSIRYVDLKFTIQFAEDCRLPEQKASALRGGMGQMLLERNCVRDRDCGSCDFAAECIVRRTMYSKYEIRPEFVTRGDSIGYVIECENYDTEFRAGERLSFRLLLYGKTIVYFNEFLLAFCMLGNAGLGRDKARFYVVDARNFRGDVVADGGTFDLGALGIRTVYDYAEHRLGRVKKGGACGTYDLSFHTPVSIKHGGEFIRELEPEAFFASLFRRIYSFDCFEGNELPLLTPEDFGECPKLLFENSFTGSIRRFSSTQNRKMEFYGLKGHMTIDGVPDDLLLVMLAGERLHIGKNTSFGFGRYTVKPVKT